MNNKKIKILLAISMATDILGALLLFSNHESIFTITSLATFLIIDLIIYAECEIEDLIFGNDYKNIMYDIKYADKKYNLHMDYKTVGKFKYNINKVTKIRDDLLFIIEATNKLNHLDVTKITKNPKSKKLYKDIVINTNYLIKKISMNREQLDSNSEIIMRKNFIETSFKKIEKLLKEDVIITVNSIYFNNIDKYLVNLDDICKIEYYIDELYDIIIDIVNNPNNFKEDLDYYSVINNITSSIMDLKINIKINKGDLIQ